MSGVISACGVALLGVFLALLLSEAGCRGSRLVSISATLTLLLLALSRVSDVLSELEWLRDASGIDEVARLAIRIVGIGYIAGISYDIASDLGQHGVASSVLTVGRVEMLLATAPAVTEILRLASSMI